MGYSKGDWKRRIAERTDMSTSIVHLTRETNDEANDVEDILFNMLSKGTLKGSSTESGFICGDRKAVCFQDTPLTSLCQNVFFEQKQIEQNQTYKLRYRAFGLLFDKQYAFSKGARPVIYDKTSDAKKYLPQNEWWRIVNLNLDDEENIIDWTHEREWRHPDDFNFNLKDVTLVVINQSIVKSLVNRFKNDFGIDLIENIKGIVTLEHLLF